MNKKLTTRDIKQFKSHKKIVMITAYDALFAKLFDDYVDMILVGDSLNMSFLGCDNTIEEITIKQMIYHAKAVCRGTKSSFIVADMPFGSYSNKKEAMKNARKLYRHTPINAVKLEGGLEKADTVHHLCTNGIAVLGHIGLLPQQFKKKGGYFIAGNSEESKQQLINDAKALEQAGVFAIVAEGIKAEVATSLAKRVSVPIIGIGSGVGVDGQVLVWSDMLGLFEAFKPQFVREYLQGGNHS